MEALLAGRQSSPTSCTNYAGVFPPLSKRAAPNSRELPLRQGTLVSCHLPFRRGRTPDSRPAPELPKGRAVLQQFSLKVGQDEEGGQLLSSPEPQRNPCLQTLLSFCRFPAGKGPTSLCLLGRGQDPQACLMKITNCNRRFSGGGRGDGTGLQRDERAFESVLAHTAKVHMIAVRTGLRGRVNLATP